jgi:HAD superfamily hydrolase (TIGR01509 family)
LSRIRAIIFDLDGLMVDSEPLARQAWQDIIQAMGRKLDESVYASVVGLRIDESSHILQESLDLPINPKELAAMKASRLAEILANGIPIMPGLLELISTIDQRALPWAVATSSNQSYARAIIDQLELSVTCQAIAGGDEVKQGKPAPDIYLLAAERLSISPDECMALEDSVPGARAAVSAGMRTIGVPSGSTSEVDLQFTYRVLPTLSLVAANLDNLLN